MIKSINFSDFCDAFFNTGRNEQFSYDAKKVIFEYLEDLEEHTGEQIELDVIAICCDFMEIESALDYMEVHTGRYDRDADMEEEELEIEALNWLEGNTTVIPFEGGYVIQQF